MVHQHLFNWLKTLLARPSKGIICVTSSYLSVLTIMKTFERRLETCERFPSTFCFDKKCSTKPSAAIKFATLPDEHRLTYVDVGKENLTMNRL